MSHIELLFSFAEIVFPVTLLIPTIILFLPGREDREPIPTIPFTVLFFTPIFYFWFVLAIQLIINVIPTVKGILSVVGNSSWPSITLTVVTHPDVYSFFLLLIAYRLISWGLRRISTMMFEFNFADLIGIR